jgi:hypothetical protein
MPDAFMGVQKVIHLPPEKLTLLSVLVDGQHTVVISAIILACIFVICLEQ